MLGGGTHLNQQATVAEIENVGKVRLYYRVFAYATHTHTRISNNNNKKMKANACLCFQASKGDLVKNILLIYAV